MSSSLQKDEFIEWLMERRENMYHLSRNSHGSIFEMYQAALNVLDDIIKKYKEAIQPKAIENEKI